MKIKKQSTGFTLLEVLIGAALFAMIGVAVYQGYTTLITLVSASRVKIAATDLINEELELVRNLQYKDVGEVNGIPAGVIPSSQTLVRDGITFTVNITVRNIDDPFDGKIGGSPNDLSPADYKLVQVDVDCATCKNFQTMSVSTRVSPKNLETASTNGALFVKAIDANGHPISGAQVHIENNKLSPRVVIDDVTGTDGTLQVVDAPPANLSYEITVTKSGYTTDKTYATSTSNPNPVKPHATVLVQQVTQISFVIDQVSTVNVSTISDTCSPIGGTQFTMSGTRLLGSSPDVYKYNQTFTTDATGRKTISNVEWDNYAITLGNNGTYLQGVNPLLPVSVLPGAVQNINLILTSQAPQHLLVTVKDSTTSLPVSGATVTLSKSGFNQTAQTGRGYLHQTDWSGGSGQINFTNSTQFFTSDGHIDVSNPTGEIKLNNVFGAYETDGNLTSSTFDAGTTSNFNEITFAPTNQPQATGASNIRFLFASATTTNPSGGWNFLGPDGTNGTYYGAANENINSVHNGDRYFRYKVFLNTASTTFTPNVSDVAVTFTSECIPPGQVLFSGLSSGTYSITVDKTGYSQIVGQVPISSNWQQIEVILQP